MVLARTSSTSGRFDLLRLTKLVRGFRMRGAGALQGSTAAAGPRSSSRLIAASRLGAGRPA
jgi:hypothetical protein